MKRESELTIHPDLIGDYEHISFSAAKKLNLDPLEIISVRIIRKSIDARSKTPQFKVKVEVYVNENPPEIDTNIKFTPVKGDRKIIIVGGGPAGMFAALRLIELGIKPIIIERGKDVKERRRDLRAIQQDGIVNVNSNYCFGEGGAGTYSDGKLYTRSNKRGNVDRILNLLVQHGAQTEILIDAHPHIGSNILPKVVESIRETIIKNNGEIRFNSQMTDLIIDKNKVIGIIINDSEELIGDAVVLATGHSARDIYYLLEKRGIKLEAKEFAMGVRIEHPQQLIDQIRYHSKERHKKLPASSYNISCQVDDRGVYSFCMCPGGIIIPASTAPGELVLNGMSVSRRDSKFANSGLVVTIKEKDWREYNKFGVFAGLEYQKAFEHLAFEAGGRSQTAPAQRITDFVKCKLSDTLPETSYIPGVSSAPLHEIIPHKIAVKLQKSMKLFDRKMKGYFSEEAQILAAETRTSSPVRIPRDNTTLMHIDFKGLFPSGEGAGYAGGILSAAIDGERAADAVVSYIKN